jgi:hypothetical protein
MPMADEGKPAKATTAKRWLRIPNGTKVRHRLEGYEGSIDGLTEIVQGSSLNPDGKTQYRVYAGTPARKLVAEQDLLILAGQDGLVIIDKASAEYRTHITGQLHETFKDDRFVTPL